MKKSFMLLSLSLAFGAQAAMAQADVDESVSRVMVSQDFEQEMEQQSRAPRRPEAQRKSRLTIGGYGEAVMSRNFYSDNYLRYTNADTYKDADSHGRFDLPHVVVWLGYDFGRGWSLGTEIEFEHGGTESAVEIEEEEAGEYESEVERGGEVALEQFWIQKTFSKALSLKMGHFVVPVGATNCYHMPTEYFTCYRPEGESTILPCTWHETGISLWGRWKAWRYEVCFISGLDSDRFDRQGWIANGAGSPYEFTIANNYAGALRIDNYSVKGLRLSVSGYIGNSFKNTLTATTNSKYDGVTGTVTIGTFDFAYDNYGLIVRGNFDYGHLTDASKITTFNMSMRTSSVSPQQSVASDAIAVGIEAGYDILPLFMKGKNADDKLYVFGRYEYYDSMYKVQGSVTNYSWCGRQRVAAGLNYKPMKEIVVKGEYSIGLLKSRYNNEPSISLAIAYYGLFNM